MGGKWNRWETPIADFVDGKRVVRKEYNQWAGMYNRAVVGDNDGYYDSVDISETFLNYDLYMLWAKEQVGFLNKDSTGKIWAIDKDIVGDGSVYSEDVCVFVPAVLNNFIRRMPSKNTDLPQGVVHSTGSRPFVSSVGRYGRTDYLGGFYTPEEAHLVYCEERLKYIKELEFVFGKMVDERVFPSLYRKMKPDTSKISN